MPSQDRAYRPPPDIAGVTEAMDKKRLTKQIADTMGARDSEQTAMLAAPLFEQGMMQLRQAAELNPRLAPMVRKALGVLTGADQDDALPTGKASQMMSMPGSKMRY